MAVATTPEVDDVPPEHREVERLDHVDYVVKLLGFGELFLGRSGEDIGNVDTTYDVANHPGIGGPKTVAADERQSFGCDDGDDEACLTAELVL